MHDAADIFFRDRNNQSQTRDLLDGEQRGIGAGTDQRAGMDQPFGDHAIERAQI